MDNEPEATAGPPAAGRGSFGLGLLVGALLGATVALLFAPAPGRDTRRRLRRRLEDVRDRVGEGVDEIDQRVRREIR
ncbi:MAG: YtxH domain-containing protein, partial [Gemmatimonadetes bacterium]|nr:YtxH domain-containing protein [Gemmatimonadota bacterium]